MTADTLHGRIARAHLAMVMGRIAVAAEGGGDRSPYALAADAEVEASGTPETPGTPKRAASDYPCAVPTDIPKKSEKKNVPGIHRTCGNCYFAMPAADQLMECHARSPKPSSTTSRVIWPIVGQSDWCGEWSSAEDAQNWDDGVTIRHEMTT